MKKADYIRLVKAALADSEQLLLAIAKERSQFADGLVMTTEGAVAIALDSLRDSLRALRIADDSMEVNRAHV